MYSNLSQSSQSFFDIKVQVNKIFSEWIMQLNLRLVDCYYYRSLDCALGLLKGSALKERPIWAQTQHQSRTFSPISCKRWWGIANSAALEVTFASPLYLKSFSPLKVRQGSKRSFNRKHWGNYHHYGQKVGEKTSFLSY